MSPAASFPLPRPLGWLAAPGGRGDAAVAVAGALTPLAFAPFGAWPLASLGLAVLFLGWLEVSPRRAVWRGWLYGTAMLGAGVFWIHESFQFQQVPLAVAVVLTGLLVMAMALYPALTGWLVTRLPDGSAARLLVLFPAVWTLQEWLRSWLFTGFPWLMAGYPQVDGPLAPWAPVAGVLGVTLLSAVAAGALAALATRPRRPALPLVTLAVLAAGTLALHGVSWTGPAGEPLAVALIQGNVPQDQKWLPERRQPTMNHYFETTRAHGDADLIVWPETAVPDLYHGAAPFLGELQAWSRETGQALVLGIPYRDAQTGLLHNSVVSFTPTEHIYHKRHLVPFGEFVPLRDVLEPAMRALGLPVAAFEGGPDAPALATVNGHPLGLSVCYEGVFGELVRGDLPQAGILVNLSNDAWFGRSIGPPQHLQMARMRALETGRPMLRATNTGITAIIGPHGQTRARVPQFQTTVLRGQVQPMTGTTPYVRWGEWPVVALALIGLVTAGWRWRR